MLFCGTLERSINPDIESIVKPSVSKNQKDILAMWALIEKKTLKKG